MNAVMSGNTAAMEINAMRIACAVLTKGATAADGLERSAARAAPVMTKASIAALTENAMDVSVLTTLMSYHKRAVREDDNQFLFLMNLEFTKAK